MTIEKSIEYTAAGRDRLAQLESFFRNKVEQELRERKSIPGDAKIEVTASDIEDLNHSMSLRFRDSNHYQIPSRDLIVKFYATIGIGMFAAGVLYPMLDKLPQNPIQLALIGVGLLMGLVSFFMYALVSRRQKTQELQAQFEIARVLQQQQQKIHDEYLKSVMSRFNELNEHRQPQSEEHISKP